MIPKKVFITTIQVVNVLLGFAVLSSAVADAQQCGASANLHEFVPSKVHTWTLRFDGPMLLQFTAHGLISGNVTKWSSLVPLAVQTAYGDDSQRLCGYWNLMLSYAHLFEPEISAQKHHEITVIHGRPGVSLHEVNRAALVAHWKRRILSVGDVVPRARDAISHWWYGKKQPSYQIPPATEQNVVEILVMDRIPVLKAQSSADVTFRFVVQLGSEENDSDFSILDQSCSEVMDDVFGFGARMLNAAGDIVGAAPAGVDGVAPWRPYHSLLTGMSRHEITHKEELFALIGVMYRSRAMLDVPLYHVDPADVEEHQPGKKRYGYFPRPYLVDAVPGAKICSVQAMTPAGAVQWASEILPSIDRWGINANRFDLSGLLHASSTPPLVRLPVVQPQHAYEMRPMPPPIPLTTSRYAWFHRFPPMFATTVEQVFAQASTIRVGSIATLVNDVFSPLDKNSSIGTKFLRAAYDDLMQQAAHLVSERTVDRKNPKYASYPLIVDFPEGMSIEEQTCCNRVWASIVQSAVYEQDFYSSDKTRPSDLDNTGECHNAITKAFLSFPRWTRKQLADSHATTESGDSRSMCVLPLPLAVLERGQLSHERELMDGLSRCSSFDALQQWWVSFPAVQWKVHNFVPQLKKRMVQDFMSYGGVPHWEYVLGLWRYEPNEWHSSALGDAGQLLSQFRIADNSVRRAELLKAKTIGQVVDVVLRLALERHQVDARETVVDEEDVDDAKADVDPVEGDGVAEIESIKMDADGAPDSVADEE